MISRKELKEQLNSLARENFSFSDSYDGYLKALNDVLDWVDEQPQVDNWIPCEKELPPRPLFGEDSYFIQEECVKIPYSAYWNGKVWTDVNDKIIDDVVAWMPLPYSYVKNYMIEEHGASKEFLEECKEVAKKYKKPMTNADVIRNMTDEELAEWLYFFFDSYAFTTENETLKWLTSRREGEE